MREHFQMAGASVVGKEHRRTARNNQDSLYTFANEFCFIALVADGCGSQPHSEVGAWLWPRMLAKKLAALSMPFAETMHPPYALDYACQAAAQSMFLLDEALPGELDETFGQYALTTIVGLYATKFEAEFLVLGDGIVVINDEVTVIESPGNAPAYPAYGAVRPRSDVWPEIEFQWRQVMPLDEVESFVLATDGASDLMAHDALEGLPLQDRFYSNPDRLRRHLTVLNGGVSPKPGDGLLSDDTTLILGRRQEATHD